MQSPRRSIDRGARSRPLQAPSERKQHEAPHGYRPGASPVRGHNPRDISPRRSMGREIHVERWAIDRSPRLLREDRTERPTNVLGVQIPEALMTPRRENMRRIQEPDVSDTSDKPYVTNKCCVHVPTSHEKRECWITGCAVLSRDHVILVDAGNNRVKTIACAEGLILSRIILPSSPKDIAVVTGDMAVVTLPSVDKVQFLSVTGPNKAIDTTRSFKVDGYCNGIDHFGDQLFVSFVQPVKIDIFGLQGETLKSLRMDSDGIALLKSPQYLVASDSAIFISDTDANSVVKLSHEGHVISRYTDANLRHPCGLTITEGAKLLVCSQDTHAIHVLTLDCQKDDILLQKQDGVFWPHVIDSCRESRTLYISSTSGQPDFDNYIRMYTFN